METLLRLTLTKRTAIISIIISSSSSWSSSCKQIKWLGEDSARWRSRLNNGTALCCHTWKIWWSTLKLVAYQTAWNQRYGRDTLMSERRRILSYTASRRRFRYRQWCPLEKWEFPDGSTAIQDVAALWNSAAVVFESCFGFCSVVLHWLHSWVKCNHEYQSFWACAGHWAGEAYVRQSKNTGERGDFRFHNRGLEQTATVNSTHTVTVIHVNNVEILNFTFSPSWARCFSSHSFQACPGF